MGAYLPRVDQERLIEYARRGNFFFRSAALRNFVKAGIRREKVPWLLLQTGSRPNVCTSSGIRHALRTGTVIITQDFGTLPNDLRSYYCFEYRYTSAAHEYGEAFERFTASMHEKIRSVITNNFPGDSPVSDFLGYERYSTAREFEQEKDRLIVLLEVFKGIAVKIHTDCEKLIKKLESAETFPHHEFVNLMDLELLNELCGRLLLDFSVAELQDRAIINRPPVGRIAERFIAGSLKDFSRVE